MDLPVVLKGIVHHGNKLGRLIDMPTANIVPDIDISHLTLGVYYSKVLIDGVTYKGITNLGKKPTVQNSDIVNVETFIYDFEGELYEKEISVELYKFRRPEKKFNSFEELSEEMHRDLEAGRLENL